MTHSTPILEVRNLSIRYPLSGARWFPGTRRRYLDAVIDVNLALQPGRTTALVGESGSGKSTLGRTIVGLQTAVAGDVLFDGRNPFAQGPGGDRAYHRSVAMMFQDPITSLSPRRSVAALIAEPFVVHGWNRREIPAEVRRLLALVGLHPDIATRYPHQLSGGQARRVGVARAIALNPKLIVADEPTAGLDVSVQADVLNLLLSLQQQLGLSYLIITHNLALVRHVSDETAVMYMGRIVERGPTADVFARPAHPYTRALLEAQPLPDPDFRREEAPVRGEIPSLLDRPKGCDFASRCSRAQSLCADHVPPIEALLAERVCRCYFPLAADMNRPVDDLR
jgi:oligopeptide/dipeptide ABC transporter ATP-binding protein